MQDKARKDASRNRRAQTSAMFAARTRCLLSRSVAPLAKRRLDRPTIGQMLRSKSNRPARSRKGGRRIRTVWHRRHGGALESTSNTPFCSCKQWHRHQGHAGQNNAGHTALRWLAKQQMASGLVDYVRNESPYAPGAPAKHARHWQAGSWCEHTLVEHWQGCRKTGLVSSLQGLRPIVYFE